MSNKRGASGWSALFTTRTRRNRPLRNALLCVTIRLASHMRYGLRSSDPNSISQRSTVRRRAVHPVSETSDIALMERISAHNADALKALYDRYGRIAFALAYRVLGEAAASEEIVQDAFETVWNKGDSFDAGKGGNVRGWLLTIVHRRAIDYRRREFDRPPYNVPIEDMEHSLAIPDTWKEVSATLLSEHVRAAMATLPDDQRHTIELAYFEGYSHREIASREDTPVGTVKGRLRLGLRKLSDSLRSELDTSDTVHERERMP